MSKKQEKLTQEEIWDDSALIDSWNEALQEYKKYHSIHAKGGSVRDLEPQNWTEAEAESGSEQPQVTETDEIELESGTGEQNKAPDESLKKLLMSWYYAGYYTGLYEGQQQAQQK
ncbi:Survival motor neuron 1 [Fusarium sp. NRRL 52700]|nr:Survival motor neuron 1 [Fusarium sp. NRRL 52700]